MKFIFDRKLFLYLSLAFILMTVIGTISHEYGHYISAKILGYGARVNYGMTILENNQSISRKESFIITLGGSMQTILTGTLGMILLYIFRKSFNLENHSIKLINYPFLNGQ
jgi:hypothetical protein